MLNLPVSQAGWMARVQSTAYIPQVGLIHRLDPAWARSTGATHCKRSGHGLPLHSATIQCLWGCVIWLTGRSTGPKIWCGGKLQRLWKPHQFTQPPLSWGQISRLMGSPKGQMTWPLRWIQPTSWRLSTTGFICMFGFIFRNLSVITLRSRPH